MQQDSITLLYGAKEKRFNNAVALKEYLEEKIKIVLTSIQRGLRSICQ
jgi:hypothetical protein